MGMNVALLAITMLDAVFIVLSQTALWQRKEYRIDRIWAYLVSPESNAKEIILWASALILALLGFLHIWFSAISIFLLLTAYIIRAFRRGVHRPVLTIRSGAVMGIAMGIIFLLLAFSMSTAGAVLVVALSPLIVALAVGIIASPSVLRKRNVIRKATQYRKSLADLTVIGITGSVGKTSTKTYALHILQTDTNNIVATHKHRNSPYVVAIDILTRVTNDTALYIAELAAYRPGEIKELCNIVQPRIGVITAITNQHLAMFGSVERLARTKWELAEAIPETGILVLNKDDQNIRNLAEHTARNIIWYSMQTAADVMFEQIAICTEHIKCDVVVQGKRKRVRIPVVGRGQLGSVLAACTIGHAQGMSLPAIAKRLASLPQIEKTMQYIQRTKKKVLIDDSYSASEASIMNAIEYLKTVGNEKSLLVLVPIIELGPDGRVVHERIGAALADAVFRVVIYGNAYQADIMRGFAGASCPHIDWYANPKVLAGDMKKNRNKYSIILLEGRVPNIVREALP